MKSALCERREVSYLLVCVVSMMFVMSMNIKLINADVGSMEMSGCGQTVDGFKLDQESLNLADDDWFGHTSGDAVDLNGDGILDLINGAPGENDETGAVYILFLDDAQEIVSHTKWEGALFNVNAGEWFGSTCSFFGTLGEEEHVIAVGAILSTAPGGVSQGGALFLVYATQDGDFTAYDVISDTQGGFSEAGGVLPSYSGFGMATAINDLNEDGVNDVIVGAFLDDDGGTYTGALWVIFLQSVASGSHESQVPGSGTVVKSLVKLSKSDDTLINSGVNSGSWFGMSSVLLMQDWNDDDIDADLIVGGPDRNNNDAGAIYLTCLARSGVAEVFKKLESPNNMANDEWFGSSIGLCGDINADGVEDIIVGAMGNDEAGYNKGAVYQIELSREFTVVSFTMITSADSESFPFPFSESYNIYFGAYIIMYGRLNHDGPLYFVTTGNDVGDNSALYMLPVFCVEQIDCASSPCLNSGTCIDGAADAYSICDCSGTDFTGSKCQIEIVVDDSSWSLYNYTNDASIVARQYYKSLILLVILMIYIS